MKQLEIKLEVDDQTYENLLLMCDGKDKLEAYLVDLMEEQIRDEMYLLGIAMRYLEGIKAK